ncbi:MAG: ABC transporter substrate-binding protein [Phycisphaerae bacterium]|nr:ABC transporter substrate-binding protein [Phycisphaerae bacterium]
MHPKEPIKIGLANTLTGTASTAGIHIRNGAILAVEQANAAGGIHGRMVELLVRDDKGDPAEALRVDQELIDEGVVAILGHYLSTLSMATVPLMNEKNVLMIGLGSITSELTGLDDNFLRVEIPIDREAPMMADLAYNRLGLRDMVIVYDAANQKLADSWCSNFSKEFRKLGGRVSGAVALDSREKFSAPNLARQIIKSKAQGVFLVTNGIHGALICQHLRREGSGVKIVASGWTFPDTDFLANGGLAVEGVVSVSGFEEVPGNRREREFRDAYERRFGESCTEPAQNGYEGVQILLTALAITNDPQKLKSVILDHKIFPGVGGIIVFDPYGDPVRAAYFVEIRDRRITTIGKTEPSNH